MLSFLLFFTPSATALSCAELEAELYFPFDAPAPLNTQIVAFTRSDLTASLVLTESASGLESSVTATSWPAGDYTLWTFAPDVPLTPLTDYYAALYIDSDAYHTRSFSTGDAADEVAPTAPALLSSSRTLQIDEWGDWNVFAIDFEPAEDDSQLYYQVEFSQSEDLSDALVRYALFDALGFYDDPCSADEAALLDPETTWIRVTAIDVAGNASSPVTGDPSELGQAFVPPETGSEGGEGGDAGGCAVAAAPWASGLAGFALALVGLRRRR